MKLTRSTPAFDLGRLADFNPWLRHPFTGFPAVGQWLNDVLPGTLTDRLAADVYEDPAHYFARFELPGVKKDDLQVELHENLLTVSAERRETQGGSTQSFRLSRSIAVPEGVQADAITAKLEDGILTVTLPKPEQRQPRLIDIQ